MRTRKFLITLVVSCLFIGNFNNCEETRPHERNKLSSDKQTDVTSNGRYLTDFNVNDKESSLRDDRYLTSLRNAESEENDRSMIHSNNTTINIPGSSELNNEKSVDRSTAVNLPKETLNTSESSGEGISENPKNHTVAQGICSDMDIRNYVYNFDLLKDCRVIEGFLHIILLQSTTEADFQNLTFPQLREVTGYVLLYRVDNLKTLNVLFPNLEVIRGDILLADYSLMIYEMQNLQEIGLNKLTEISRGAVRIEFNPSLCYTSTVDWKSIVAAGETFIKDNSNEVSCPVCSHCPGGRCWNAKHCQRIKKTRCHDQCLGECYGTTDVDCYVCKNFRHEGRCVETCPAHLYTYRLRRCITKEECLRMNNRQSRTDDDQKWRPFSGSCLTSCPDGYEDAIDGNNLTTCRVCKGRCRRIGQSAIIRHISDAQSFRGTTVIKGALEFQMRNGNPNILNELTDAFGMVEEITEYLKISHSFPITTLDFFKKLRVIKGEKLDINNASLVVLDNPNLSNLFPESQQIEIQNGRLFFHYNPKLCLSKIERLGKMVGIANFTELEVQPESNGEKIACDIVTLNISVREFGANYANLVWDVYNAGVGQRLLSYLLNYIETDNENISYEGNACGRHNNNTWQIIDVEIPRRDNNETTISQMLFDLKPHTKYAVYVKTLAARNRNYFSSQTGQSKIIFFRTKSDVPSVATDVISFPVSDNEIVVEWGPPEHPNGPIHYYMISGFIRPDNEKLLLTRDYCKHGLVNEFEESTVVLESTVKTALIDAKACCTKDDTTKPTSSKKFEIFCHENMTISYLSSGRKNYCRSDRYNVADTNFYGLSENLSTPRASVKDFTWNSARNEFIDDTRTRLWNGIYYSFVHNVTVNKSSYLLKKLRHYSLYTISVAACGQKLDNGTQMCSSIQYTNSRTKKLPRADDIANLNVHVMNNTIVTISWDSPTDPNGLTVGYTIEYTNTVVKDAKKTTNCITQAYYLENNGKYFLQNLSPGKYSVRVRSMSLAGDGTFTNIINFTIAIKEDNTIVIVLSLTVLSLITILAVAYFVTRNHQKKRQQRLIASVNPDYIESKYVKDGWEVSRDNIEILEELGLGNFGMVYHGILAGTTHVAVKTIPGNSTDVDKNEFLNEASVMKNFTTNHIIRLLGVVSDGSPPYVIMELMDNGDLKTYLRKIRETNMAPDLTRIIRMAGEIADGMSYLESKKFVHRDLAARNCMVARDLVCKIGDFGMARDIYATDYYKIGQKGLLPIRWMAPENLSDGVFTSDSDVWSYGIVLYEILTLAEIPYQGFSNDEVLNYVLRRGTVNVPRNSPELIVKLMEKCFKWRPSDRPTFMEIVAELEPFLCQDFCDKSFYHSDDGVEIRNLGLKKVYHHAAPIRFHWGNETARWVKEFEDNVTLLDQTKAGTSRGRIFKNGFQHFGNMTTMEEIPLDR